MRSKFSFGFIAILVAFFAIVGTLAAPKAGASEYDKRTVVTFNEPVEVPGMILPAGTYVFKLADIYADPNIVGIYNSDETQLIARISAIADYRMQPSGDTIINFDERPAGQPEAIKEWFYPGENQGLEFVYPKTEEVAELKQGNQPPVLLRSDQQPDNSSPDTTEIEQVAPAPEELAAVAGVEPVVQPQLAVANSAETELPQTASSLGSIAAGGLVGLVAAFGLRRFSGAVDRRP